MDLTPEEKIRKARIELQNDKPFFAYLVVNLNLKEEENLREKSQGGIGVDYRGNLHYEPEYIDNKSLEVVKGMVCHEVLHLALQYFKRQGNRNPMLWNIAHDYQVNYIVKQNDMKLPPNILYNEDYNDMSGEGIYDDLLDKNVENKKKCSGSGQENGEGNGESERQIIIIDGEEEGEQFDHHMKPENTPSGSEKGGSEGESDNKNGSGSGEEGSQSDQEDSSGIGKVDEEELKRKSEEWKRKLIQASQRAKERGNVPAGMERVIDDLLTEKVNWTAQLKKYLQKEISNDYTWSKPSKKYYSTKIYMPSVKKENIDIVIAIDTSGSISKKELSQFMTEMNSIRTSNSQMNMTVLVGDAELQEQYRMKNGNTEECKDLKLSGGGGTKHEWVYRWIDKNKPNAKVLVALTDGYTSFPENKPRIDTIWVSSGAEKEHFPFGRVVEIEVTEDR